MIQANFDEKEKNSCDIVTVSHVRCVNVSDKIIYSKNNVVF